MREWRASAPTTFHLGARKVAVTVVHGFEFAAVDRDARFRQKTHLAPPPSQPVRGPGEKRLQRSSHWLA